MLFLNVILLSYVQKDTDQNIQNALQKTNICKPMNKLTEKIIGWLILTTLLTNIF